MENYNYNAVTREKTDGFCVAGLVVGIVSFFTFGTTSFIGLIFSIIGVLRAKNKGFKGKGMGIGGIVTSAISQVVGIILVFIFIIGAAAARDKNVSSRKDKELQEKDFGSYKIIKKWEEVDHDRDNYVYCAPNTNGGRRSDGSAYNNIIVTHGTNRYDEDEHEEFRDAILQQLGMQVGSSDSDDVQIHSGGSTTENGYILYEFEIIDSDQDTRQVQYYIVGDREYVLVSEMVWDEDEAQDDDIDKVASAIVDSFEWSEDR